MTSLDEVNLATYVFSAKNIPNVTPDPFTTRFMQVHCITYAATAAGQVKAWLVLKVNLSSNNKQKEGSI